jgi:nitronate monooxygenase
MAGFSLIVTRFVATKEAGAHEECKTSITRAKASDTALTVRFSDGGENASHRVLRNRTLEMWEAAGCRRVANVPARAT